MRVITTFLALAGVSRAMRRSPEMALMPRATDEAGDDEMPLAALKGISPIPTQAPKPRWAAQNLFKREDSNTCGYVHYYDDPDEDVYPITCDSEYLCTNVGNVRDCCRSESCSSATFSTVCLDATDCPTGGPSEGTFCCTFSTRYPYCVSYLWSSSTDPNDVATLLNCRVDTSKRIGVLEADSTSSESSSSADETTPDSTPTPTDPATDTDADTDGSDGTDGGDSGDDGDNGGDNDDDDSGGGSNTGAIVGGVVGGVAGIGLIVLAAVFFIKKRGRKDESPTAATTPATGPANPHYSPQQQMQQPMTGFNHPGNTQSMYSVPPQSPNPSTAGYPSPVGSPAPYQYGNMNMAAGGQMAPNTPGGFSGAGTPGTAFATPSPDNAIKADQAGAGGYPMPPAGTYPPPQGSYSSPQTDGAVAEAPAQNQVGTTENRAELG